MRDLLVSRLITSVPFAVLAGLRVAAAWQVSVSERFQDAKDYWSANDTLLVASWTDWADGGTFGAPSDVTSVPVAAALAFIFLVSSITELSWSGLLVFLLAADILPVYFLKRGASQGQRKFMTALLVYSLSTTPLILFLGPDLSGSILLLSAAALVLSLWARKFGWASVASVLLIATDPVLGIFLLPCLLVLLVRMRLTVRNWFWLLSAVVLYVSISVASLGLSSQYRSYGFDSPTWEFVTNANVDVGSGSLSFVLIVAVVFMGILWRIRRVNKNLISFAASSLVFLISLVPGAPASWSLVVVPFLLGLSLLLPFWRAVIGIAALNLHGLMLGIKLMENHTSIRFDGAFLEAYQTLSIMLGVLVVSFVWKSEVANRDFLRLRSRPALVLVAGDSGVGKDTLAEGLSRSLGLEVTALVSGDDYHVWDRGKASWNFVTHLNPSANELSRFARDVMRLTEGRSIEKGTYNHQLGRRLTSETSRSREFVVASGLHALWARDLNQLAALKIFISMSDDLRILLKTSRDSARRGYLRSQVLEVMGRRKADSENFIAPQRSEADLAIHLESDSGTSFEDAIVTKLYFSSKPMLFDENLVSELSNTCGLEVMWESDGSSRTISVSGTCDLDSLRHAFARLEPEVSSVLGPDIDFDRSGAGVIQMVVLVYLVSALRLERLI